jgi:hypothetical protein
MTIKAPPLLRPERRDRKLPRVSAAAAPVKDWWIEVTDRHKTTSQQPAGERLAKTQLSQTFSTLLFLTAICWGPM